MNKFSIGKVLKVVFFSIFAVIASSGLTFAAAPYCFGSQHSECQSRFDDHCKFEYDQNGDGIKDFIFLGEQHAYTLFNLKNVGPQCDAVVTTPNISLAPSAYAGFSLSFNDHNGDGVGDFVFEGGPNRFIHEGCDPQAQQGSCTTGSFDDAQNRKHELIY